MTFLFDRYIKDGANIISETYGVMPIEDYVMLCEKNDIETFNEFGSMPSNRMIFTAYHDELSKQDDKRMQSKRMLKECQRVYSLRGLQ